MLCKHPNIKVNQREDGHSTNALGVGVLVMNFPDLEYDSFLELFLITLSPRFLMGLKIMLSFYSDQKKNKPPGQIVVSYIDKNSSSQEFMLSFIEENSICFYIKRNVVEVELFLSSEWKAAQSSRPVILPKPPENPFFVNEWGVIDERSFFSFLLV